MVKVSVIFESAYVRWFGLVMLCFLMSAAFVLLGITPRSSFSEQAALMMASYALLRTLQSEGK